jgi:2-(1,2-epoxy-1,2-dihydrophenyl)acetyl-CoA isomerase
MIGMAVDQIHYGVRVGDDGPVRTVVLDRPGYHNALDLKIRPILTDLLVAADHDPAVRAIVITGANQTFCAGGDLTIMARLRPAESRPRLEAAQAIVLAIAGGSTPVVAAVEGAAFGAGLGLALACDRVVAGSGARFSAAFTRVGLACDLGLTWTLPQRVGVARARQMMMAGDQVDAHGALAMGLVDEVVPEGTALAVAQSYAAKLADGPPRALALLKEAFWQPALDLPAALAAEVDIQVKLCDTDDYAEGIAAIRERRSPLFGPPRSGQGTDRAD